MNAILIAEGVAVLAALIVIIMRLGAVASELQGLRRDLRAYNMGGDKLYLADIRGSLTETVRSLRRIEPSD